LLEVLNTIGGYEKSMSLVTPSKTATETIFDNLGGEIKDAFDKFGSVLAQSLSDVAQVTVQTKDSNNNILYTTIVTVDGGVSNVFQVTKPDANDPYWTRHNAAVDQAVQNRNQMMLRVIDTVGGVVKIIPV